MINEDWKVGSRVKIIYGKRKGSLGFVNKVSKVGKLPSDLSHFNPYTLQRLDENPFLCTVINDDGFISLEHAEDLESIPNTMRFINESE